MKNQLLESLTRILLCLRFMRIIWEKLVDTRLMSCYIQVMWKEKNIIFRLKSHSNGWLFMLQIQVKYVMVYVVCSILVLLLIIYIAVAFGCYSDLQKKQKEKALKPGKSRDVQGRTGTGCLRSAELVPAGSAAGARAFSLCFYRVLLALQGFFDAGDHIGTGVPPALVILVEAQVRHAFLCALLP